MYRVTKRLNSGRGIPSGAYAKVKAQMIASLEEYELYGAGDDVIEHEVHIDRVDKDKYVINVYAYIWDRHGDYAGYGHEGFRATDTVPDFYEESVEIACDAIVESLDEQIKKAIEDTTRDDLKLNLGGTGFKRVEVFYNSGNHKLFADVVDKNNYSHHAETIVDGYYTGAIVQATDDIIEAIYNELKEG